MNRVAISLGGGIGKMIAFSSLTPALKEKYGEVILINPYPMVFYGNTFAYRNYTHGHEFLFEDHLSDIDVYKVEPYEMNEYRKDKMHLIDVFAKQLKLEKWDKKAQLFINRQEEAEAVSFIQNNLKGNEFVLMQICGGTSLYNPQDTKNKFSFSRDLPISIAQEIVNKIHQKYPGLVIIQAGFQTEPMLKDVINMVNVPIRAFFPLMKYCKTFISIDSFLQHTSSAFNKKGIVCWGGTDPKKLGYEHNINLENPLMQKCKEIHCHRPDTYFFDQEAMRAWSCPFDYECMNFDPDYVMESFDSIIKESVKK